MTFGQNAPVRGGGKHLAYFRSDQLRVARRRSVATVAEHVRQMIVSAGGGAIVSNGGTLTANELQLSRQPG